MSMQKTFHAGLKAGHTVVGTVWREEDRDALEALSSDGRSRAVILDVTDFSAMCGSSDAAIPAATSLSPSRRLYVAFGTARWSRCNILLVHANFCPFGPWMIRCAYLPRNFLP